MGFFFLGIEVFVEILFSKRFDSTDGMKLGSLVAQLIRGTVSQSTYLAAILQEKHLPIYVGISEIPTGANPTARPQRKVSRL